MHKNLKILRILLSLSETSGPYNLLSLPLANKQDITICTYFKSPIGVLKNIHLIDGDDSLKGFFTNLKTAFSNSDFDLIHAHTPHVGFLYLLFGLSASKKKLPPKIFTLHCSYNNLKFRNRLMLIPVFMFFQRIVFCSHASKDSFPSFFLKLAGRRSRVVVNGVDLNRLDRFLIEEANPPSRRFFQIVSIGRLIPLKNPLILLRAFGQVCNSECHLTFIGEGHLISRLRQKASKMGIKDKVTFTGLIPRVEVFRHLAKASLFVSVSTREGMPIAVLEAMACKCPVILSDIPPHREISQRFEFIPLIKAHDIDGLAQTIKKIIEMPDCQRIELGEKCRKLAEERFCLEAMHEGYNNVYREVIKI